MGGLGIVPHSDVGSDQLTNAHCRDQRTEAGALVAEEADNENANTAAEQGSCGHQTICCAAIAGWKQLGAVDRERRIGHRGGESTSERQRPHRWPADEECTDDAGGGERCAHGDQTPPTNRVRQVTPDDESNRRRSSSGKGEERDTPTAVTADVVQVAVLKERRGRHEQIGRKSDARNQRQPPSVQAWRYRMSHLEPSGLGEMPGETDSYRQPNEGE